MKERQSRNPRNVDILEVGTRINGVIAAKLNRPGGEDHLNAIRSLAEVIANTDNPQALEMVRELNK